MDGNIFRDTLHVLALVQDFDEGVKLEHARRTALMAFHIAKSMDLPHPQDAAYCGFLHDIGGMGLPDHVVHHATLGFADPAAREHASRGAAICEPFTLFSPWVSAIADHHENFDGTGFPARKKGEQIGPLAAVVHLADHLEVCLRDLPSGLRRTVAAEKIRAARGTRVAPMVADAAMELLKDEGFPENLYDADFLEIELEMLKPPSTAVSVVDGEDALLELLWLLARVMESRHPYTMGHSARVARLAFFLARELGPGVVNLWDVVFAALLHDIGKVAVPLKILDRRDDLSTEQWDILRTHAEKSRMLIERIGALRHLAHPAASHHERYGGGGYPMGISGESIPLIGRILAYADAYDAMTTERGYNVVLSHEQALAAIRRSAGTHFDPLLLSAALKVLEQAPRLFSSGPPDRPFSFFELSRLSLPQLVGSSESALFISGQDGKIHFVEETDWIRARIAPDGRILDGGRELAAQLQNIQADFLQQFVREKDQPIFTRLLEEAGKAGHACSLLHGLQLPMEMLAVSRSDGYDVFVRSAERQVHSAQQLAMMHRNFSLDTDAVAFLTPAGMIFDANERFAELARLPRRELTGQDVHSFLSPELSAALRENERARMETFFIRADGAHVPVDASVAEIFDAAGERSGFLLRLYDISERVETRAKLERLTQELERRNRELENLSRLKSELVAVTSHDIKSPLSGIIASARFLLDYPDTPKEKLHKTLGHIVEAGEKLMAFVQDLLDLERMESGRITLEKRPLDLVRLAAEVVETVSSYASARRIRIETDFAAGAVLFTGDGRRLQQVLHNLLSNAVKFSPDGGRIQVGIQRVGRHIRLTVRDEGPGIPADQLESIFDRYHQVRRLDADARGFSGAGLGLSIVRHLVTLHGGRVWAESPAEGGSLFSVELPLPEAGAGPVLLFDPSGRLRAQLEVPRGPALIEIKPHEAHPPEALALFADGGAIDENSCVWLEAMSRIMPVVMVSPRAQTCMIPGVHVWQEPVLDTEVREFLRTLRMRGAT